MALQVELSETFVAKKLLSLNWHQGELERVPIFTPTFPAAGIATGSACAYNDAHSRTTTGTNLKPSIQAVRAALRVMGGT